MIALKAYSIPGARAAARRAARRRHGRAAGAERRALVVLPVVRRRARGHGVESVDPGGVVSRVDRAAARDRLRLVSGDGARRARRRPARRGHALHDRRARRSAERALPARSPRRSTPAGSSARSRAQIRGQLWLKLIGNVAFNSTTALTGATLGELALVPGDGRARARDHGGVRGRRRRARDRAAGVDRAPARGGDRRRRPPHVDAPGPRGRQAARARLPHRRRDRDRRPASACPVPQTRAVDAAVRLRTALRDREAGARPRTPVAVQEQT